MKSLLTLLLSASLIHAEWANLWPNQAPGAPRPPAGTESIKEGGRITGVEIPQYSLHRPQANLSNGAAVVIFPGGGYSILAASHEGTDYANWLTARGYTAIIVKYRVGAGLGYQYPVPFLDARRAIRTVRAHAEEWGVKPDRVGVMGSSAGGHLASLCATRFNDSFPEETSDATDQLSARPDFAILIYPVISMGEIGHGGSRENLAGKDAPPELIHKLSTEKAVSKLTPPTFLLSTSDDGVDSRNSLLFATALKENGIPHALHVFPKGGHGYGLKGKGPLAIWPTLLESWLSSLEE